MSQSPLAENESGADEADDPSGYRAQLAAVDELIDRGASFSGHERNCAFLNTGPGARFATVSAVTGLDFDDDARAPAPIDWDGDGDLDLWIANRTAPMLRFLENGLPESGGWTAFDVVGTTCARDAIGALIEVVVAGGAAERRLVKSRKAGEGFLAQASRWVHFGLGDESVRSVTVRWPGGEAESFSGVTGGARWRLVEGAGRAEKVEFPAAGASLAASEDGAAAEVSGGAVAARVGSRPLFPTVPWTTFGGESRVEGGTRNRPLLVSLWATWCAPCVGELKALEARRSELEEAGLDVLLLSVDGLAATSPDAEPTAPGDAAKMLARLGATWPAGTASAEVVRRINSARQRQFGDRTPLPVPASILLDPHGRLGAIYLGPVEIERLLDDTTALALDDEAYQDAALPFSGRWFQRPKPRPSLPIALDLMEHGFPRDAAELARRGDRQLADEAEFPKLLVWIADTLTAEGSFQDALPHFEHALELDSENAIVRNNFAWQLAAHPNPEFRDGRAAVRHARRAAELTGFRDPSILDTLAAAYAEAGAFRAAVRVIDQALELAETERSVAQSLAASRARYAAGQPQPAGSAP